jgi:hypothetical protein
MAQPPSSSSPPAVELRLDHLYAPLSRRRGKHGFRSSGRIWSRVHDIPEVSDAEPCARRASHALTDVVGAVLANASKIAKMW